MSTPDISVAVPSHERPLRLRWLLNALEEQSLERDRFEVVVVHDSAGDETEELLNAHALAHAGTLRHVRLDPGTGSASRQRNLAWSEARAPLVAFTDDDCRPEAHWLERLLEAAARHPGAVIQGRTTPDPEESALLAAPYRRTIRVDPPVDAAQTCNILYPREVLERAGGFDEEIHWGEDMDLWMRAKSGGAELRGAPEALVWHAILPATFLDALRATANKGQLPLVVKRHPELRRAFPLWAFYHRRHVWLPAALAGAVLERRNPLWALLAVPYAIHALPSHGTDPRGRLRGLVELPGRVLEDAVEFGVLAAASARYRTLFL